MTVFREVAPAKINLALHVRQRRADGYHDLETLFAFAEDGDVLDAAPAPSLTLAVEGPFADALAGEVGDDNLVLRAARALRESCGITAGAALRLDKRLPVAAGIGGGSADAAAALRLLCRLWGITAPTSTLLPIASGLGADVPACLLSQMVRGDGRGDRLRPIDGGAFAGMPLLLVNPLVPLPTAAVFAGWDGRDRGALPAPDLALLIAQGRNDLEAAAIAARPVIREVLACLGAADGSRLARMSGSGATCFALFEDPASCAAAAAEVGRVHPNWWCLQSRLR